jgi:hypothetical protein
VLMRIILKWILENGLQMCSLDLAGSVACLMAGFGISSVEPSGSATRVGLNLKNLILTAVVMKRSMLRYNIVQSIQNRLIVSECVAAIFRV